MILQETDDKNKNHRMRWGVERRMAFIDFRLYWEGRINRADLTDFFGISVPQASNDIQKYIELSGGSINYDKKAKCYYPENTFTPKFISPSSDSFINELLSIELNLLTEDGSYIKSIPSFSCLPLPHRTIEPTTLFRVSQAIKNKMALYIEYQSMNREEPTGRLVSPHALGFDGFRWHVRAFCHERQEFRDFVFARILSISGDCAIDRERALQSDSINDSDWHNMISVRIGPHSDLNNAQKRAIELDYGMTNGEVVINVRIAMCFYLLKQLGLNKQQENTSSKLQHIVLINYDEVINI